MTLSERETLRAKLLERLEDEGAMNLAAKLEKCGEEIPLCCTGCGTSRVGRVRCDQRWCPVCQFAIATQVSMRYERIAAAANARWMSMVTFTSQHSLGSYMTPRETMSAFRRLRRLRWWKKRVAGGVASCEISKGHNGWHVHIHALIDCEWLSVTENAPGRTASKEQFKAKGKKARKELSEQWSLCCKRPGDVWVRRASGKLEEICREVLKYSVKGTDLVEFKGQVSPVIRSMTGTRLVVGWGSWYRHKAIKRQEKPPAMCKCGCSDWMMEKTVDWIVRGCKPRRR